MRYSWRGSVDKRVGYGWIGYGSGSDMLGCSHLISFFVVFGTFIDTGKQVNALDRPAARLEGGVPEITADNGRNSNLDLRHHEPNVQDPHYVPAILRVLLP